MIRLLKLEIESLVEIIDYAIKGWFGKMDRAIKENPPKQQPLKPSNEEKVYSGVLDFLLFGAYQYKKPKSDRRQSFKEGSVIEFKNP